MLSSERETRGLNVSAADAPGSGRALEDGSSDRTSVPELALSVTTIVEIGTRIGWIERETRGRRSSHSAADGLGP